MGTYGIMMWKNQEKFPCPLYLSGTEPSKEHEFLFVWSADPKEAMGFQDKTIALSFLSAHMALDEGRLCKLPIVSKP